MFERPYRISSVLIFSVSTLVLPYCPSLVAMQGVEFLFGLGMGAFRAVVNQLLIRVWTGAGRDSSPYMYTLHLFSAIGCLVTPILSKPFLQGDTSTSPLDDPVLEDDLWSVKTLYPIISAIMLVPAPLYLYYFLQERREEGQEIKHNETEQRESKEEGDCLSSKLTILLLVFTTLFYFTTAGMEIGFRNFISVFCVNSSLAMTRNQAADILTIFYTTFSVVRALLVPASTLVSSSAILWSSALTLLTSTTLLSVWGDTEVTVLRVGIALTGAGEKIRMNVTFDYS